MAFDGAFLHNTVEELKMAIDCHIDKIYQPSRDELVFLLRKKGFNAKLLMSIRSPFARVHFTEAKYENPAAAPMFCMLLRKHFSSAKLLGITQIGLERVVEFEFEATNEMGDRVRPKIICELIGNKSNIILVAENGRIIDAVRRSDIESGKRLVLPGAVYEYPEAQGKSSLLDCDIDLLVESIVSQKSTYLCDAILSLVDGLSPLICREIAYKSGGEEREAVYADKQKLKNCLLQLKGEILKGTPTMLLENGVPTDFTYTDISQYGTLKSLKKYDTFSGLLDAYYMERDLAARIKRAASDILKIVNNAIIRAKKRLANRNEELKKCADREKLRIYGELLKANLYSIKSGAVFAEVQNYYDELKTVRIPLDSALTPAANAAKYFKEYKKSHTAEQTLLELTREDEKEIIYLESVLDSIKRSESLSELQEIREELITSGYILKRSKEKNNRKVQFSFKEYISPEGYQILVGKNNRQNDEITTKIAAKNDTWFHAKNIPGSHVIVRNGGKELSEETILLAASLAAQNSKAANSSGVPVDYTSIKNVKKPNGAKPGMVIYTTNQTVFVTPRKETE